VPHRGYMVADRDGRHHDYSTAWCAPRIWGCMLLLPATDGPQGTAGLYVQQGRAPLTPFAMFTAQDKLVHMDRKWPL